MQNKDLLASYDYVWDRLDQAGRAEAMAMGDDYRAFLDNSKTERMCTSEIVRRAEAAGFTDLARASALRPGDKVYSVNRGKSVVLAVLGEQPVSEGMHIVGSHIDSPRLDLKANPLYEDGSMALFKTHYYGGVKKYQWVARPLALHGVVVRADGSCVEVHVGDSPADPVFYITDLLPHLAGDQMKKKLADGIEGEALNAIVGTLPSADESCKARFKLAVMELLHAKYGIVEKDFVSAELELVPAGCARDVGFDRAAVAAYGQDDRVCAYAALRAILGIAPGPKTAVALFVDKEEIGSVGSTGMHSRNFANTVGRMIELQQGSCTGLEADRALARSALLSSDVCAAFDPNYPSVTEARNNAVLGKGVAVIKYTGSRGKKGSNDASAEYLGKLRCLLDRAGIVWQTSELGKVDQGGGGTIAYILANCDMDVVDIGVPLLSMHAPYELVAKADVYMTSKAYRVFYENEL